MQGRPTEVATVVGALRKLVAALCLALVALLMAAWDEPVLGFFPIAAAVVVAWAIGEYVTNVVWKAGQR